MEESKRTNYQVLIFPYNIKNGKIKFVLFQRRDLDVWQGIAGGGEVGESPLESAKRESFEEAGIPFSSKFIRLASISSMPVVNLRNGFIFGKDTVIIPEFAYGVKINDINKIKITPEEHSAYGWYNYNEAMGKLNWDSNRTALWELNHRLISNSFLGIQENTEELRQLISKYYKEE